MEKISAAVLGRATPGCACQAAIAFNAILVVATNPGVLAGRQTVPRLLLTAQRRHVKEVVHRKEHVQPPKVSRVSVEDAVAVAEENTQARHLPMKINSLVVVVGVAFVRVQADMVIVVEIIVKGRNPGESPLHSLLIRLDPGERGA